MLQRMVSCCNSKNDAMQYHGTSFSCRSTKNSTVACNTTQQHIAQCCGTKNMVVAQKALLRHKAQCCSTKTLPQHKMQCCSMKNMAMAPTPNTSAARLIVFYLSTLIFPQDHFSLLRKVSGDTQFTSNGDTFSTCAHHHRKSFAKPLPVGFYFA